jgi:hypothetical protein
MATIWIRIQTQKVQIWAKIVDFGRRFSIKFNQFLVKSNFFDINSKLNSKFESEFQSRR